MIEGSTAVQWIDRMDIGKDDTDPIRKFYNMLVEYTDNDGTDDLLIEDFAMTKIDVLKLSGTFRAENQAEANNILQEKLAEASNEYYNLISAAYYAFDRDHPEVFWLNGEIRPASTVSYSGYLGVDNGLSYTILISLTTKDTDAYSIFAADYPDEETIRTLCEVERNARNYAGCAYC